MKFLQIMEFQGSPEDAEKALQHYIDKADGRSYARKATICVDRDNSGTVIQLIEFDSWDEAQKNNELEITEEEYDTTMNINLKSCFNYIQAVAPFMLKAKWGRIISMSSLNAHSGGVTAAVSRFSYTSAKAGILGMTRALAKELGPDILVNAVCPGLIKTEITKNAVIATREPELVKGIALKRVGTPTDVAELVCFLALSEPNFITGQDITIDGFQWNR